MENGGMILCLQLFRCQQMRIIESRYASFHSFIFNFDLIHQSGYSCGLLFAIACKSVLYYCLENILNEAVLRAILIKNAIKMAIASNFNSPHNETQRMYFMEELLKIGCVSIKYTRF